MRRTRIAIDFDGTIADHRYPDIGNEVPGAFYWMKKFQEAGADLILYTMRADDHMQGNLLTYAVQYCRSRGVEFYGLNTCPDQKSWTLSPKAHAQVFIDDHGACIPLVSNPRGRPYVDWSKVGPAVMHIIEERNDDGN